MTVNLLLGAWVATTMVSLAFAGTGKVAEFGGEIAGAKYSVWVPDHPNAKLLLLAHGYREEKMPLTAAVALDQPFLVSVFREGWTVASTSYRRNGWIVDEAVDDLRALRGAAAKIMAYEPNQTVVIGESMGGLIAARVAEASPNLCDGALALGAVLRDKADGLHYFPRIPLLFLSNENESAAPLLYVQRANVNKTRAALWTVNREGHVNLNDDEENASFHALLAFIATGTVAATKDATIDAKRTVSELAFDDSGAQCQVVGVHPVFGNVITNVIEGDLRRLQVSPDSRFRLSVHGQDRILQLKEPKDAKEGDWIAYILGHDGLMRIVCVGANTGKILGVAPGDTLRISRIP
jgi:pimeloyl-ACP methyl ester carboxylesterase